MRTTRETVLLISGNPDGAQSVQDALFRNPAEVSLLIAASMAQARAQLRRAEPCVILLDTTALRSRPLDPAVRELVRTAPVIVIPSGEDPAGPSSLEDLIVAGKVEFLASSDDLARRASAAVERRLRGRRGGPSDVAEIQFDPALVPDDFGEILRHEINNPLTGILGNAELLLARRDSLPPVAVHRLETIAELAVRLRETIRRLSNALEARADHARSA